MAINIYGNIALIQAFVPTLLKGLAELLQSVSGQSFKFAEVVLTLIYYI